MFCRTHHCDQSSTIPAITRHFFITSCRATLYYKSVYIHVVTYHAADNNGIPTVPPVRPVTDGPPYPQELQLHTTLKFTLLVILH